MKWKVGVLAAAAVVVATFFVLKHHSANGYTFVAIGGETNPCECTKRIEPRDDWWSRLWK